jgi:antitoxin component YwqK of YwqJK toxin-antitoxin module
MKRQRKSIAIGILLWLGISIVQAQTIQPPLNSGEVMKAGWKFSADEKYTEAINEFLKIDENDTNYVASQLELVDLYYNAKRDSEALALCNRMLPENTIYSESFYVTKGCALENLNKKEEAIQVYNEGLARFPKSYLLYYNRAVIYLHTKDLVQAQADFKSAIHFNPFHASSHLQLGLIAFNQGRLVPAALSLMYCLQLENEASRSKKIVLMLEKMLKKELEPTGPLVSGSDTDDFTEVEAIISSKVALNGKYKSKIGLSYDLVKQLQLLFEKLTYNKADQGYWMQTYVPFFTELYKKDYFEDYMYFLLKSIKEEPIDNWWKKHESEETKYITWVYNTLLSTVAVYEENINGTMVKANHYYYTTNKIKSYGLLVNGKKEGTWCYLYNNGQLKATGNLKDELKEGVWKYYYNSGQLKEESNFVKDKGNGLSMQYYENGAPKFKCNYVDDAYDGAVEVYYPSGTLKGTYTFKNGLKEGKSVNYYESGPKKTECNYTANKNNGDYAEYYASGKLKSSFLTADDQRNGPYTDYYENGAKKGVGIEKNGSFTGPYKSYHPNGKVKEEGQYTEKGILTGIVKKYTMKGQLEEEYQYSERGKLTSKKFYTTSGKLENELIFKNEELAESQSYNDKGEVINDQKKKKDRFEVTFFNSGGSKKSEGTFVDGQREGLWKFYDENGFLESTQEHKEDKLNGEVKSYFCNGKIKSESTYKDGKQEGLHKVYYINGKLERQGYVVNGDEQGYWFYYYVDGTPSEIKYYLNGELTGKQVSFGVSGKKNKEEFMKDGFTTKLNSFDSTGKILGHMLFPLGTGEVLYPYPNGKPRLKGNKKHGYADGEYTWYYANGKVETVTPYVRGNQEGSSKTFYYNGNKKKEMNYLNGKLDGKFTSYYENGAVQDEYNYSGGDQDSIQLFYYENKMLARRASYFKGKADGLIETHAESGELVIRKYYEDDQMKYYTYQKSATKNDSIALVNETGQVNAFFLNGKKSTEYELVDGLTNGRRVEYSPTGKPHSEENYYFGKLDGLQKYYYADGALKTEIHYLIGEEHGYAKFYHKNGKVKIEGNFLNGSWMGPWKFYDETGKLTRTTNYFNGLEIQ